MIVSLRKLLLLAAARSFYASSFANVIPDFKTHIARDLSPRAGVTEGGAHGEGDGAGEDVKDPDGEDVHMDEAPSGSDSPVDLDGEPLERMEFSQEDEPKLADLRNNDALRMQLVHQDLTEDGRDRRMNAYIRVTKAYVEKKSPNHPRLMLWTDDVESSESGDYIGKSPDLYADEEYLYYFKKGYWPLDFETHVGEGFYPWTTLLRMSKGMIAGSKAPDVDIVMAWDGDTPKSIFSRYTGDKQVIGPTFAGCERGQLAVNLSVQRIWLRNMKDPEKNILAWVDPNVPDAIPKDYHGPEPDKRPRDDPIWDADSYPVDNIPVTMPGYEGEDETV